MQDDPTSIAQGFARRDAEFSGFPVGGTTHTPTPWAVNQPDGYDFTYVSSGDFDNGDICTCWSAPDSLANATFIVRACNSFDEMLLALIGIQVIAEQNVTDICANVQEGGTLSATDKMELARWGAVGAAIAKAMKER